MLDPSESKQIQQDYLTILKAILDRIRAKAESKGFKPDDSISIQIGRNVVYKQDPSGNPIRNNINKENVELLNKALSDPRNIKGTIQIKIGSELVYKVSNGEVLKDKLQLSPLQAQTRTKTQSQNDKNVFEEIYQSVEQQVNRLQELQDNIEKRTVSINTISINKNEESNAKEINALKRELSDLNETVQSQQESIEKLQQDLKAVLEQKIPAAKKSALQSWVAKFQDKAGKAINSLLDQAKSALNPGAKLQERIDNLSLKVDALDTQIKDLKQQRILDSKSPRIKKAIGTLLHLEGDRNEDGSISLETEDFTIKQQGSNIFVNAANNGRELIKDGQLTRQVTDQDLANFEQLVTDVNQYLENSLSTSQSQAHSHSHSQRR